MADPVFPVTRDDGVVPPPAMAGPMPNERPLTKDDLSRIMKNAVSTIDRHADRRNAAAAPTFAPERSFLVMERNSSESLSILRSIDNSLTSIDINFRRAFQALLGDRNDDKTAKSVDRLAALLMQRDRMTGFKNAEHAYENSRREPERGDSIERDGKKRNGIMDPLSGNLLSKALIGLLASPMAGIAAAMAAGISASYLLGIDWFNKRVEERMKDGTPFLKATIDTLMEGIDKLWDGVKFGVKAGFTTLIDTIDESYPEFKQLRDDVETWFQDTKARFNKLFGRDQKIEQADDEIKVVEQDHDALIDQWEVFYNRIQKLDKELIDARVAGDTRMIERLTEAKAAAQEQADKIDAQIKSTKDKISSMKWDKLAEQFGLGRLKDWFVELGDDMSKRWDVVKEKVGETNGAIGRYLDGLNGKWEEFKKDLSDLTVLQANTFSDRMENLKKAFIGIGDTMKNWFASMRASMQGWLDYFSGSSPEKPPERQVPQSETPAPEPNSFKPTKEKPHPLAITPSMERRLMTMPEMLGPAPAHTPMFYAPLPIAPTAPVTQTSKALAKTAQMYDEKTRGGAPTVVITAPKSSSVAHVTNSHQVFIPSSPYTAEQGASLSRRLM